ncbi:MAG: ABC transporter permease, partial [Candidatus Dormibacteraceae bacterium]
GFISSFFAQSLHGPSRYYLLMGAILWEIIRLNQYTLTLTLMWNYFSHNVSNLFVAPLNWIEFIIATIFSAATKTLLALLIIAGMGFLFGFDLRSLGAWNLILFFINLSLFAWSLGLLMLGLILYLGLRMQALAWGVVFFFQPLCAAYFPLSILPQPLHSIALALPPTYVFEAARRILNGGNVDLSMVGTMFGLNAIYMAACGAAFFWLLRRSQKCGQFAKNDQ